MAGRAAGASQSASLSMVAAAVSWKNTSSDMLCQICCVRSSDPSSVNLPAPSQPQIFHRHSRIPTKYYD